MDAGRRLLRRLRLTSTTFSRGDRIPGLFGITGLKMMMESGFRRLAGMVARANVMQ
jgi:hypothetical protein